MPGLRDPSLPARGKQAPDRSGGTGPGSTRRTTGETRRQRPSRYPQVHVSLRSQNPLALVAAVREALRLAGVARGEIRRFTDQAFAAPADRDHVRRIVETWIGHLDAA